MEFLSAVVFFTIFFQFSNALDCYKCLYHEGYPDTNEQCRSDPGPSLVTQCPDPSPLLRGEMTMCKKVTATLDGRLVVQRGCSRGFVESDGTCHSDVYLRMGKFQTNDAEGCACTSDRCNSATRTQFTYIIPLIAGVVYKTLY